jgi:hypothetical protein
MVVRANAPAEDERHNGRGEYQFPTAQWGFTMP